MWHSTGAPKCQKREEKGVQDMGYMQDTYYKIQDTAYMPGIRTKGLKTTLYRT
jgi:hypothetical protein